MNISSTGYQSRYIKAYVLWAAATKAGVLDVCPRSLHGDTGNLEYDRGRESMKMGSTSFPGEDCSLPLVVYQTRIHTLRLPPTRHTHRLRESLGVGWFWLSLCAEPQGDSWSRTVWVLWDLQMQALPATRAGYQEVHPPGGSCKSRGTRRMCKLPPRRHLQPGVEQRETFPGSGEDGSWSLNCVKS